MSVKEAVDGLQTSLPLVSFFTGPSTGSTSLALSLSSVVASSTSLASDMMSVLTLMAWERKVLESR